MPVRQELPEQLGRYRILRKLGAGGMGAVYLAEDTHLGRRVALKVPHLAGDEDPAVRQRFQREARLAASVEHPNLCPVHDVGEADGIAYFVMSYVEGIPLSKLVAANRPWPPGRAAALVRKLALALNALHKRGLIHRDLKPGNVMVRANGEPVLMDFGLACCFDSESQRLTGDNATLGTPAYMSPEQASGDTRTLGPATDVYSLGVILYELLTGRPPFEGPPVALLAQVLRAVPEPPAALRPGLGADLNALCLRAMAKKPKERFRSMTEFAAALATVNAGGIGTVSVVPRAPGTERGERDSAPETLVRIVCPQCGKALKVPPNLVGKRLACPNCRTSLDSATAARAMPSRVVGCAAAAALALALAVLSLPLLGWLLLDKTEQEFTNSIGMRLVRIPAGTFQMGSPVGEVGHSGDEEPHPVRIARPFYLGACEVTQRQYKEVMGRNPAYFNESRGGGLNHPVERVTWEDAVAFCRILSARDEEKRAGRIYRLPTEAEWEYACRGGSRASTPFHFGAALAPAQANFNGSKTTPAGSYASNAFGLYDMHGNVAEWCADWYDRDYYKRSARQDPRGPTERPGFAGHVLRGGSWGDASFRCRSASRDEGSWKLGSKDRDRARANRVGFRVVCVLR